MSMSDCINCWDTPCTCGYNYISWGDSQIDGLIKTLRIVKDFKKQNKHEIKLSERDDIRNAFNNFRKNSYYKYNS